MPRTKVSRKPNRSQDSQESDILIKDFERHTQISLMKLEAEARTSIKSLENFVDVEKSRLPPKIQQMTIGEIIGLNEDNEKENEILSSSNDNLLTVAKTAKNKKTTKRITAASDDGYVTESTGTVTRQSRARKVSTDVASSRGARSSSRNSKAKLSEINQTKTITKGRGRPRNTESSDIDKFKTPAMLKPNSMDYGMVTPKIKPNTPMNVLRRPRQGETVISLQGSPLLVSAVVQEKSANINVPLGNGNVMSLLPMEGLRMSHVPALDSETKRQLETLKNHIEKVILMK